MSTTIYRGYKIVQHSEDDSHVYKDGSLKIRASCVEDAHDWIDKQWSRKATHHDREHNAALQAGRST